MKKLLFPFILMITAFLIWQCQPGETGDNAALSIAYEKYQLGNGLEVILHEDKSDPIVAVAILVHVGSNREKPGRTGFAHYFEHMLFQHSENVPDGAFFKNIDDWGGTFNGGTWSDGTIYFEMVPKDALEKIFWMESDRMGFFINSVTTASLEGEKPVVQNEKRQGVDNQPYGHTSSVIKKALYPSTHPYNWTVIGELEDIQNATLEDVKEFYETWYGPNNATLVVVGDFETTETKAMIEKYFGEIPARGSDTPMEPQLVTLDETKRFFYEDNFASLPEIRLTFPTVQQFHPDYWALNALGSVLDNGKRAVLYKVIEEEKELASGPAASNNSSELAGEFTIRVRAKAGVDLDTVKAAIFEAFDRFDRDGFDEKDLERIRASQETNFYNGISSVLDKAFNLAEYNEFVGDPGYITEDINKIRAVTREDVIRVFNTYIKDKNYVETSFVPKGQTALAVEGAVLADIKEEAIVPFDQSTIVEQEPTLDYPRTPSAFDRSQEPTFGEAPLLNPPSIWTSSLSNGMNVWGINQDELPLVNFSIRIPGGLSAETPGKVGVTNLLTDLMMEGTATKTPEELEDAIGQLGSNINMYTSNEFITISANCLSRNYEATLALVEEIITQPRWDEAEFARLKRAAVNSIQQRDVNPNAIAGIVMNKMLLGANHILAQPIAGTLTSVESITVDDLKNYYNSYLKPGLGDFHVAGSIGQAQVEESLTSFAANWTGTGASVASYEFAEVPTEPKVYFVDIPDAKQSVIQIGRLAGSPALESHHPLTIANYRLGDGSAGRLFQILREEKQFTYGAYSNIPRTTKTSWFIAASSVKSNVTKEAVDTFKEIIGSYGATYTEEDLEKTKVAMIKFNSLRFETLGSLMGILQTMSTYDLPVNYIDKEQEITQNITIDEVHQLIAEYMDLSRMVYVIVGDKATQLNGLRVVGVGNPVVVDKYGNREAM